MSGKQEIIKSMIGGRHDILIIGRQKTNADRIRAMSDEELAMWMQLRGCPTEEINSSCMNNKTKEKSCTRCWLDWLKAPVEEGK